MKKFLNTIGYKLRLFMYGRYGYDTYNYVMMYSAIALMLLASLFLRNHGFVYQLIDILAWAIWMYSFYRAMSRNVYKRARENELFLLRTKPLRNRFKAMKKQRKDTLNKYYVCPKCAQMVRVPKGRGKITITCPSCRATFDKKS